MRYEFSDDLRTGNTIIDTEHKTLIQAADDAMQDISNGKGKESIQKTTTFLSEYTKTHFAHEEELQEKSKYPDIVAHKVWHKQFVATLSDTAAKISRDGISSLSVIELTRSIGALITHIKTEDKKLANHIAKQ